MSWTSAVDTASVGWDRLCDDRVVIVTGAGRGIGRSHALDFARHGAMVVVNDLGAAVAGDGSSVAPAEAVAAEIRALGGQAIANSEDVADWGGAQRLVAAAVEAFGRLDVLVNNAGNHRAAPVVDMAEEDWDAVVRVHLKGAFCPTRAAASYWRQQVEAGQVVDARVICTTSQSGLFGMPTFSGYGAAKAGVAAFTIIAARELADFGVTVNAIAPRAATRMADAAQRDLARLGVWTPPESASPAEARDSSSIGTNGGSGDGFDPASPDNISPLVVWLSSPAARAVTGRVFQMSGGEITLLDGWSRGPSAAKHERWQPEEIGAALNDLLERSAEPVPVPV
jgi:NAD(P)-dependent dehydrogenase (short-subunit alcohol dehydrogenase family)